MIHNLQYKWLVVIEVYHLFFDKLQLLFESRSQWLRLCETQMKNQFHMAPHSNNFQIFDIIIITTTTKCNKLDIWNMKCSAVIYAILFVFQMNCQLYNNLLQLFSSSLYSYILTDVSIKIIRFQSYTIYMTQQATSFQNGKRLNGCINIKIHLNRRWIVHQITGFSSNIHAQLGIFEISIPSESKNIVGSKREPTVSWLKQILRIPKLYFSDE